MAENGKAGSPNNPRIFVSCVSGEFGNARLKVRDALEFIGFEIEYQESFPTNAGDLRSILRDKIDKCDGVLQIIGDAYGAEPPVADENFGRVSYTQYEYLYAKSVGKAVWPIFAAPEGDRDKPVEQLDLPKPGSSEDPIAYQQERQLLQRRYKENILERKEDMRWHFANTTELENHVLRMRRELEEVREQQAQWQRNLKTGQDQIGSRVQRLVALGIAATILIVGGLFWLNRSQDDQFKNLVLTGGADTRKTSTSELVKEDMFVSYNVMVIDSSSDFQQYVISVGSGTEDAKFLFQGAEYEFSLDGGDFGPLNEMSLGQSIVEHYAFTFESATPPETIGVKMTGKDGEVAGPFEYKTDLAEQLVAQKSKNTGFSKSLERMKELQNTQERSLVQFSLSCKSFARAQDLTECSVRDPSSRKPLSSLVKEIRIGSEPSQLAWRYDVLDPAASDGLALSVAVKDQHRFFSAGPKRQEFSFLLPISADQVYYQYVFLDDILSEVAKIDSRQRTPSGKKGFQLQAESSSAPALFLTNRSFDFNRYGSWTLVPLVVEPVGWMSWSTFSGGEQNFAAPDGFYMASNLSGVDLGASEDDPPNITLQYETPDGSIKEFAYSADWGQIIDTLVRQSVDVVDALDCRKEAFVKGLGDVPVVAATCRVSLRYQLGRVLTEIHMGMTPDDLLPIRPDANIDDYLSKLNIVAENYFDANKDGLAERQLEAQRSRYVHQVAGYDRRMRQNFLPWDELRKEREGYIASFASPPSSAYFQFVFADGTKSNVVRKGFRG